MGWFFLVGLVVTILLIWGGYGFAGLGVFGATLVVLFFWGVVRSIKKRREHDKYVNQLEHTTRLQAQFAKESEVLSDKLKSGENVSPEAAQHYEQTYNQLMPLIRIHSHSFDKRLRQAREEAGDYGKLPSAVEICEQMHKHVVAGIARQKLPDMLAETKQTLVQAGAESGRTQELLGQWESLYSVLQQKVAAGDITSEDVKKHLDQILAVSKELFPMLPDQQIDELQARFSALTANLKARAVALMAKGAAGRA